MDALEAVSSTVGALELLMASVAIYYSSKSQALDWLRYFALGLILLSLGHIAFVGELRPLMLAAGLPVLVLSLLKALGFKRLGAVASLAAVFSIVYLIGYYIYKPLLPVGEVLLFTVLPVIAAYEVYSLYESIKSIGLLLFFLGLVIYAVATDVRLILGLLYGFPEVNALTIEMLLRMIGVALMLGGFLLA
ncbi:MAG: hypothetical protein GXO07_01850 [Crenarchaeota archaeon]|nr:hypothetical protein [Thermoproteota archaeon]